MFFGLSISSIPQGALLQQGWQSLDLRIPCFFLQKMAAVSKFCVLAPAMGASDSPAVAIAWSLGGGDTETAIALLFLPGSANHELRSCHEAGGQ